MFHVKHQKRGENLTRQEKIEYKFKKMNISLTPNQIKQFEAYYELLVKWNAVMNLTAITGFDEVLLKHFIDSAAICRVTDMEKIQDLIDVGTGAGFPGIPLKILYPHMRVTLLDSLNKRIQFLQTVQEKLGLEDMKIVHGRAEDMGQNPEYREQYSLCVSRAVAHLSILSEYCIPFVKVGGIFIAYKSEKIEEELKEAEHAIDTLHSEKPVLTKIVLTESDVIRSFVEIRKKDKLEKKYPRKAGTAVKKPL